MFSTKEFKMLSQGLVLYMHITTRIQGDQLQGLLQAKGGTGFPFMAALDWSGAVLNKSKIKRSVEAIREAVGSDSAENRKKLNDLRSKASGGDAEGKKGLFTLQVKLKAFADYSSAKAALDALKLDADATKQLAKLLVDLRVNEIIRGIAPGEADSYIEAGKALNDIWQAGGLPSEIGPQGTMYFLICYYAESKKDVALFEKSLKEYKDKLGEKRRHAKKIARLEAQLAALKAGK